jgi:hypothetical protein
MIWTGSMQISNAARRRVAFTGQTKVRWPAPSGLRGGRGAGGYVMLRPCCPALLFILPLEIVSPAFGQHFSFGLIGGASVTSDFENDFPEAVSTPKRYVAGIALGVGLTSRFSLEADGLYHPLGYESVDVSGSTSSASPATVLTWIVPVLAKYSLTRKSSLKPFAEFGPFFPGRGECEPRQPFPRGSHCRIRCLSRSEAP